MRVPFVAGNWKMNRTVSEARRLVAEMVPGLQGIHRVERVLCPPFIDLLAVAAMLEGTDIGLGAQNMYWEQSGAFTAELCKFVIIGHSERRAYFGETDATVNRKVKAAYANGLTPIVCVGETLDEYESGKTAEVVSRQMHAGLADIEDRVKEKGATALVVAYEPVWAIGTGKPSTPEGAAKVIREVIRASLADLWGIEMAQGIRVLYGGSVTGKNAGEFFAEDEIDGALVGGASLKTADFTQIVEAAVR
jgi:triosephosphate isomerase